jgi:hypothetical protein
LLLLCGGRGRDERSVHFAVNDAIVKNDGGIAENVVGGALDVRVGIVLAIHLVNSNIARIQRVLLKVKFAFLILLTVKFQLKKSSKDIFLIKIMKEIYIILNECHLNVMILLPSTTSLNA